MMQEQRNWEQCQQKESHQLKALAIKNYWIQSRQPCTNLCQIITPIICLIFTSLIRNIVVDLVPTNNDGIANEFALFPQKFNNFTLEDMIPGLIQRSCTQWYNYDVKNSSDEAFIGFNDGKTKKGLLGTIQRTYPQKCHFNFSYVESERVEYLWSPMFRQNRSSTIDKTILDSITFFNTLNISQIKKTSTIDKIPDGSITFFQANKNILEASLKINDLRVLDYHRKDGVTRIGYYTNKTESFQSYYTISEGFLSLQQTLTKAYLMHTQNKTLASGYIYMPFLESNSIFADILVSSVTTILFPLSLSLLLPVFLYLVVLEKEQKLIQMMRMNGMKMRNYWFVNFTFNLIISFFTNFVFCMYGFFLMDISFFNNTSFSVIFVVLLGWVLVQIGMATFLQVFLSSSRAANIIGYLFSIWTNLIGATLNLALYQYPREMPTGILFYPTFAFNRIFYLMFNQCEMDHCFSSLSSLNSQATKCIISMYCSFIILQLLGMYLHQVIPQEFGTTQPITFPLKWLFSRKKEVPSLDSFTDHDQQNDEEAQKQKSKISDIVDFDGYALVLSGIRKVYGNGKVGVAGMDLVISDREVFGLLGPNGAGKTTLISMITGVFSPTQGNCFVGGYSILQQIEKVHLRIGVCPQFDILWPQLTVEQHFYFYARLRGTPRKEERKTVEDTLNDVNLKQFRKFKACQLSGGMKRRLSVGISMVGNPRIVFLDEPTTGLDPQNRRNLWEVLNQCKKKRALFLTTHLMEEADTLCNRIGIITSGVLRTIGIQQKLKRIYGKGYHLNINTETQRAIYKIPQIRQSQKSVQSNISILSEEIMNNNARQGINYSIAQNNNKQKMKKIKQTIYHLFPQAVLVREINGFLRFNLGQIVISEGMKKLKKVNLPQFSQNWSISNSTLQDVFLEVVNKYDKAELYNEKQISKEQQSMIN